MFSRSSRMRLDAAERYGRTFADKQSIVSAVAALRFLGVSAIVPIGGRCRRGGRMEGVRASDIAAKLLAANTGLPSPSPRVSI